MDQYPIIPIRIGTSTCFVFIEVSCHFGHYLHYVFMSYAISCNFQITEKQKKEFCELKTKKVVSIIVDVFVGQYIMTVIKYTSLCIIIMTLSQRKYN